MNNNYLQRYAYPKQYIYESPASDLNLIVTIPSYNEDGLIHTLNSFSDCTLPNCAVEVIVVINHSEKANSDVIAQNKNAYHEATYWAIEHSNSRMQFHIIFCEDLPEKHSGVGLARKIAMDEAVRRFESIENSDGIIACFDADSLCESNYLIELENHFLENTKSPGCSIHFEHPLEGNFASSIYEAITEYELFLRYYVNALRYSKFPYAFHTIGSGMAVRSWAYQKQGGMNRKKAGEDFYFLHRIIPLGNFTELNTTKVIPSPRISDRVPFGTGKAVGDWQNHRSLTTYNPLIFLDLASFIDKIDELYNLNLSELDQLTNQFPVSIKAYLGQLNFQEELTSIKYNSATIESFRKRFFDWFNAFRILKYVHFARDNYYNNISVLEAAQWILEQLHLNNVNSVQEALIRLRNYDKACFT